MKQKRRRAHTARSAALLAAAVFCAVLLNGCGTGKAAAVPEIGTAAGAAEKNGKTLKYHTMQTAPVNRGETNGCGGIQGTVTAGSVDSDTITIDCSDTTGKSYTVRKAAIGDIALKEDPAPGLQVSLFFAGSLLNAKDDISRVKPVVLLDAQESWVIDVRTGVTTANAMSSFSMREDRGGPAFTFVKDNCPIEDGALSEDSGDHVEVTFAAAADGSCYPIKIRAAK